jgi:glycosyltransferase involved in cell wall biosynthesis
MLAPNPFKGVRYQYARGQFCLPTPAGLYYWLSQRLFFRLQRRADLLVGVNTSYESFFRRQNPNVLFIRCGAEDSGKTLADAGMAVPDKTCDACFIGRFHAQKGVLELVDIVARIVAAGRTGFRCAVIGGPADNALGRRLRRQIRRRGLERHFEILGERTGVEKLAVLAQSRVFLFPSYYESFGIVYLEAISLGVPVFEYDLPCYQDHRQGVVKVPFRDNARMAAAVVGLIGDPARYAQLSAAGRAYAKEFSWARAADAIQARADELFRRPV